MKTFCWIMIAYVKIETVLEKMNIAFSTSQFWLRIAVFRTLSIPSLLLFISLQNSICIVVIQFVVESMSTSFWFRISLYNSFKEIVFKGVVTCKRKDPSWITFIAETREYDANLQNKWYMPKQCLDFFSSWFYSRKFPSLFLKKTHDKKIQNS